MKCFTCYGISNHSLMFYLVKCWLFMSLYWNNFNSNWALVVWVSTSTNMSFLWVVPASGLNGNGSLAIVFLHLKHLCSICCQLLCVPAHLLRAQCDSPVQWLAIPMWTFQGCHCQSQSHGNDSRNQVCTFSICGPLQNVFQLRAAVEMGIPLGSSRTMLPKPLSPAFQRPGLESQTHPRWFYFEVSWIEAQTWIFSVSPEQISSYWVLVLQAASGVGLFSRWGSQVVPVIGLIFQTYDPKMVRPWAMITMPSRYLVILMQST